ncbi:WD40 repeat-like protein, partial [Gymnopus androsaceus JB14]
AHLNPDKICLKGTRVGIVADVLAWIYNPDNEVPKAFFLCGEAGTGKSTISHTIGQHAKDAKCLGAFFCFDHTFAAERTPNKALQTIAYDLSISLPEFGKHLIEVLDDDPYISTSMSIEEQWNKLIMAPAKFITSNRPVVIIIDALDECGPKEEGGPRDMLLSLLINSIRELPKIFRVFVTSRMEGDVHAAVDEGLDAKSVQAQYMSNLQQTQEDTHKYVVHRMMTRKGAPGILNESQCQILAEKAQGFFQWAYTACEALRGRGKAGLTVKKRFERCISLSPGHGQDLLPLDKLYKSILEDVFDSNDSEAMSQYRMVMVQILAAFEPLSSQSLQKIQLSRCGYLGEDYDDEELDAVIHFLGSLFTGIDQKNTPIRPVHTSVHDFLVDEKRSREYAVRLEEGHLMLAVGTLQLMITDLHFNICDLESSYFLNSQVENLSEKIRTNISPSLSYACTFWGSHIINARSYSILAPLLRKFLREVLLFWMELLSILRKVNVISDTARVLLDFNNSVVCMHVLLHDIQQFIQIFGKMIGEATPHLYLSGVTFTPKDSVIFQQFTSQLDKSLVTCKGQKYSWPSQQAVLTGHKLWVNSVTFSSDGMRIISGSSDHTVHIWNAEIGMIIGESLQGHTSSVNSVAFSPDDKRIVSGSSDCKVCIWNAETGLIIGEPLQGHTSSVNSVAFSPDGKRIVSGSADQTVRIWNVETGEIIGESLQRHTAGVNSVAFSPDGKRIVSGSFDQTLCIWNVETGKIIGESLQGHTSGVNSVAFSPDGKRIVSGSDDQKVCIWNAETGMIIGDPLQGHTDYVRSLAFSPDAQRIVSRSDDQTVCIWNAETGNIIGEPLQGHIGYTMCIWNAEIGKIIGEPLQGHTHYVRSVAFSPDGKRIVSGSEDQTVCIWNVETGMIIGDPLQGHTAGINPVAFSPDGKRIVSGSSDQTVCIWNAETGIIIGEPLKGHIDNVRSVAISPDGQRIVSGSGDQTVCIWNAKTGMIMGEPLQGHTAGINSVAFSPDGKRIVSGSSDQTVCIWNAESGIIIGEPLHGHKDYVRSVAFSPDGKRIVSGSSDQTVCIWNAETLTNIFNSKFALSLCPWHPEHHLTHTHSSLQRVHINSDGWLCGTDSSLLLWIPPEYRPGLMFPHMQILISRYHSISLDLSNFAHGKDWVKCLRPRTVLFKYAHV